MKYELLLQTGRQGVGVDLVAVEGAFKARGALAGAGGELIWRLSQGEVTARPLVEGGSPVAMVLAVALSAKAELLEELVEKALELSLEAGLQLFDPQLSRPLGTNDQTAVHAQFVRTARYAAEYAGLSEAIGAGYSAPVDTGLKAGTKVALGLLSLAVLLYLLAESLFGA